MDCPEITADTPIEEIQRIHKQIWDFVIKYGDKPKTPYLANCVCCEYANVVLKCERDEYKAHICSFCPAKWSGRTCGAYDSEYCTFVNARRCCSEPEFLADYAKKVRDIPFKEVV